MEHNLKVVETVTLTMEEAHLIAEALDAICLDEVERLSLDMKEEMANLSCDLDDLLNIDRSSDDAPCQCEECR